MSTLQKHEGHSIMRICMQCTQVCLCDRKNTKQVAQCASCVAPMGVLVLVPMDWWV